MGFHLLEVPKFSQINCLTNIFLQQFLYIVSYNFHQFLYIVSYNFHRPNGPFIDFRISPYSLFNALASFQ